MDSGIPPYNGKRPLNWPSLLLTLGGYVSTIVLMLWLSPRIHLQPSPQSLGLLNFLIAPLLVICTLWLIAFARGLPARLAMTLAFVIAMLADSMFLQGLTLLFNLPSDDFLRLIFAVLGALGSVLLALRINAEGLEGNQRTRKAQETDALTGLLNRRGLARHYSELPPESSVTLVMVDLNNLKTINDLEGHTAGDRRLRALAGALKQQVSAGGAVGRWGGDEFVVLLPGAVDPQLLMFRVQDLVPQVDETLPPFAYGSVTVPAVTPLERALASADHQMYEHKRQDYAQSRVREADFPHFLLGLTTFDEILHVGLRKGADLAGFDAWFYADLGDPPRFIQQNSLDTPVLQSSPKSMGMSNNVVAAVLREGRAIAIADYAQSVYAQPFGLRRGIKSMVALPVQVDTAHPGVVAFVSRRTWSSIPPQATQLLEAVATHLGHHFERQAALDAVQASVEGSITGLGLVLETRDIETAGHTERVVQLAAQLGAEVGLSAEQLQALRLGAYLHDVGKLAIPDAVLLKPGPLDTEEWRLMKLHTDEGLKLVSRMSSLPKGVLEVVGSHHERWDGQGYPQGLQGEGIPLLARIFALCDVYDALTHARPYKAAWTTEAARAELTAQCGKQFDPELGKLFLDRVVREGTGTEPEVIQT